MYTLAKKKIKKHSIPRSRAISPARAGLQPVRNSIELKGIKSTTKQKNGVTEKNYLWK